MDNSSLNSSEGDKRSTISSKTNSTQFNQQPKSSTSSSIAGLEGTSRKKHMTNGIYPGSRFQSISWFDKSNQILYLFGGEGYDANKSRGYFNDLWSFSIKTNEWTWLSGSNEINHKGEYGTKGVPSKDNCPGSRSNGISWIDESNQILYLFGGGGLDSNAIYGYYNDLWSFSIKTNEWTWISGSNKFNHEGIIGIQSKDIYPRSRSNSISWIDESNQILYLYGGIIIRHNASYHLNDLWSFSIKTNEWTWISGSNEFNQQGEYGEKGVPSKDNCPGSRRQCTSWFDESNQILYLFGGVGYNPNYGHLNDLWSFSTKTNEWVWLSGSNKIDHNGVYGTKGVASKDVYPGSRFESISWIDESNQILYLYGGNRMKSFSSDHLNDLWSFSIKTNEWTWISGSNKINQKGIFGVKGVPSKDIYPGSRRQCISWIDESNQILYLFGGEGYDLYGKFNYLNDLWSFSIKTNEWTWISGSNITNHNGVYGIKGVPSKDTYPRSRRDSVSWIDKSNQILYLYGGNRNSFSQIEYLNDLWSFSIKTNEWTWISGSDKANHKGEYGTKDFYPGFSFGNDSFYNKEDGKVPKINRSLYTIVEKHIKNNELKPLFSDFDIEIGGKVYKVHKYMISLRCPNLFNINKKLKESLKKMSELTSILLLQWIYKGDISNENISLINYKELYFIFKYIITNKPKVLQYILYKINEEIDRFNDNDYIHEFKNYIHSNQREDEILYLLLSKLPKRYLIDIDSRIELFKMIDKEAPNIFDEVEIKEHDNIDHCYLIKDYEDDIRTLIKTKQDCDILFDFGDGRIIQAHKSILYSFNILFELMNINLTCENDDMTIIKMISRGYNVELFEMLIDYIYSYDDLIIELNEHNFECLYDFLHFLSIIIDDKSNESNEQLETIKSLTHRLERLFISEDIEERTILKIFKHLLKTINQLKDKSYLKYVAKNIINRSIDINELTAKEKFFLNLFKSPSN